MSEEEFEAFIKNLNGHPDVYRNFRRLAQLHSDKNTDYAAGGPPLGNFERVAHWIEVYKLWQLARDRPQLFVALLYSLKQIDAVFDMLGKGRKAKVEDIPKKMDDVIVYWNIGEVLYNISEAVKEHNEK